jgi:pyruvate kinase
MKPNLDNPKALYERLLELRDDLVRVSEHTMSRWRSGIERRAFTPSALNLAHYLALRQHDLRELQDGLSAFGLSSLGRSEARVLPNLDAVIHTLAAVNRQAAPKTVDRPNSANFSEGRRRLERNATAVLGKSKRRVRIMVTLPTEAADDPSFAHALIERGTNCVRINCAHDDSSVWAAMVAHVRNAAENLNRECRVLMDLGGPKLRTEQVSSLDRKRMARGDCLLLTTNTPDADPQHPFQASLAIPEVLEHLGLGVAVWYDGGKLGAVVERRLREGVLLRVTHAAPKGVKLKPDKGVNFPGLELTLSPLTPKDLENLDFVARHADMIGYSFVQTAEDVALLQRELHARTERARRIAIVAKIETPRAIANLPEMIVQAAGRQPFAVMIARGDLAVEIGYQRLAEMQEELLWLCEAAHVPVIWATQVLENLVKTGVPSRAEMTDAAMSGRAECVMLNKGAFVTDAVSILDDVLTRMERHQSKKSPRLRALKSWGNREKATLT